MYSCSHPFPGNRILFKENVSFMGRKMQNIKKVFLNTVFRELYFIFLRDTIFSCINNAINDI